MTDNLRCKYPASMGWEELVIRERLGSFERALLFHNNLVLGELCQCVGSIRRLPREDWLHLPWMDVKTHEAVVGRIKEAAGAEI